MGKGQARRSLQPRIEPAEGAFLECRRRPLERLWIPVLPQNLDVFENVTSPLSCVHRGIGVAMSGG